MYGNYIVSFMGVMPSNNPKVVVYIAIDNAKGATQYGGTIAAPIARNILLDIAGILKIEKEEGGVSKNYNYYDKRFVTVPNVIGMDKKEVVKILKNLKVEFSGSGNKVIYQSPSAHTTLYEGDVVKIMLGD